MIDLTLERLMADPDVLLAARIDKQFDELLGSARRFIDLLSQTPPQSSSAETVSWEIATLHSLVELALRGLDRPSGEEKLVILEGINRVCAKWIECGLSHEFLRAVTIQNWTRIDMPSNAET